MAKELGIGPKSLVKNIPSPSERWKAPVSDWVKNLYRKKFGNRRPTGPDATNAAKAGVNHDARQPSSRQMPEVETDHDFTRPVGLDDFESDAHRGLDHWRTALRESLKLTSSGEFVDDPGPPPDESGFEEYNEWCARVAELENAEPDDADIAEQNARLQTQYYRFRLAAALVTRELLTLPAVQRVELIGSTANPLWKEVPRFREYRRYRIAVWHECKDVDLAVWVSQVEDLKSLQKARNHGLQTMFTRESQGVASHQLEMFLLEPETNRYLGRLCKFKACPASKRECLVPGCGEHLFLQQHENFRFDSNAVLPDRSILLFARTSPESGPAEKDSPGQPRDPTG